MIRICKFSVRRILLFQRVYLGKMYIGMKDEEFEQLMNEFCDVCKKKKQ